MSAPVAMPRPSGEPPLADGRRRPRIFLGLKEVAGYYSGLEAGLRATGVQAHFFDLAWSPYQYAGQPRGRFVRFAKMVNGRRNQASRRQLVAKALWGTLDEALRVALLFWAIIRYDAFIFAYKRSFLPRSLDLPLLKLFRKHVIFTFHGSDGRPPYIDGSDMAPSNGLSIEDCIRMAKRKKAEIRRIERWADAIISHAPYAQLHERPFISVLQLGTPVQPTTDPPLPPNNARPRILHAPSERQAKGTLEIRATIERLRERGYDLDYVEISGQPNAVVLEELGRCDVVVDQLYSDAPLASFATEAAVYGRPVIVGGLFTTEDFGIPADRIPPSHMCHPEQLESVLERLVADPESRRVAGERLRQFVTEQWAPERVAERYLRVLEGDIPPDWFCDPNTIWYVGGCGISAERSQTLVRQLIKTGGTSALQLDDKPLLRDRFKAWAQPSSRQSCSAAS